MMSLPPLLVMLLVLLIQVSELCADENEYRLMRYLMATYDKSVRPSKHASESLNITFGVALTQIIDVDERNQILTTNCWLNQVSRGFHVRSSASPHGLDIMWIDYNLQWNESDFGGIHVIRIPADKVWKPDIILYNNADSQYNLAVLSTNVIVSSDGNLTWLSSAILKSSCGIDVEYFPFDEQQCTLKFASWTYDGHQLNLVIQTEDGDLSNYVTNGEWDLIDVIVKRNVVFYSCCEAPYPDVTYRMVLRRRPLFYAFNLILPCILITGIALMSFYMPSDSGEKVTLGITTLLSMTVFLMVIGESMPPTSEKLPLIGIYYGVTISLVTFATGLAVVTLNIHHRGMRGREVSPVVKKFVLGFLARILFIKLEVPERMCPQPKMDYQEMSPVFDVSSADELRRRRNDNSFQVDQNGGLNYRYSSGHPVTNLSDPVEQPKKRDPYCSWFECHVTKVLDRLHRTIEQNDVRLTEQDRKDTIRTEWQQVALVLDRFLLLVFIVATVGATWSILYMSPHTKLF